MITASRILKLLSYEVLKKFEKTQLPAIHVLLLCAWGLDGSREAEGDVLDSDFLVTKLSPIRMSIATDILYFYRIFDG